VRAGVSLDRQVERLRDERTQLIATIASFSSERKRGAYDQMIALVPPYEGIREILLRTFVTFQQVFLDAPRAPRRYLMRRHVRIAAEKARGVGENWCVVTQPLHLTIKDTPARTLRT